MNDWWFIKRCAEHEAASHLTSCFLGSRMLSSLSAYTFLEAVNSMI